MIQPNVRAAIVFQVVCLSLLIDSMGCHSNENRNRAPCLHAQVKGATQLLPGMPRLSGAPRPFIFPVD